MSIIILAIFSFLNVSPSHCGELKKKSDDKTKKTDQSADQEKASDIEDKSSEEGKDTILDVFLEVYVFTSKKDKTYYHNEECELLDGKGEKVKLSDLKKKGKYKPCKKCRPPDGKE